MHIVSEFVFIHMSIPFRTFSRFFFAPRFKAYQQDAGGASKRAPKTDEVMEDDGDEELTGPVVGNFSGFFSDFSGSDHP